MLANICGTYNNHLFKGNKCMRCGFDPNPRKFKTIKVNLGCGLWLKKDYINVDKFYTEEQLTSKKPPFSGAKIDKPYSFIQSDIGNLPFPDDYADYVEMSQVIEHFPMKQMYTYMKEVYRVMKPGARLLATIPSFNGVIAEWMEMVACPPFNPERYLDLAEVIYGNQLADGEMHKTPITPEFINWILSEVGFKIGKIYIAPRGSALREIKFVPKGFFYKPKSAVFRNDNIILDITK